MHKCFNQKDFNTIVNFRQEENYPFESVRYKQAIGIEPEEGMILLKRGENCITRDRIAVILLGCSTMNAVCDTPGKPDCSQMRQIGSGFALLQARWVQNGSSTAFDEYFAQFDRVQ